MVLRVQIQDETVYISYRSNVPGDVMHQTMLPLAKSKYQDRLGVFYLGMATNLREGKSQIHTC